MIGEDGTMKSPISAARRLALLAIPLLLAGCDERRALCDKAVEKAMAGKQSYELLEVIPDWVEGPKEGEGVSWYKYIYRYISGPFELNVVVTECLAIMHFATPTVATPLAA